MNYEAILQEIHALPLEERRQLMHAILDSLLPEQPKITSIKQFRGAAAHLRDPKLDAQAYVNQLRDESGDF